MRNLRDQQNTPHDFSVFFYFSKIDSVKKDLNHVIQVLLPYPIGISSLGFG